jgi:hypothetical protein
MDLPFQMEVETELAWSCRAVVNGMGGVNI